MSNNIAFWIMIGGIIVVILNYLYTIQQNTENDDTANKASSERKDILKAVIKSDKNKDLFDMIAQERKKEINDNDRSEFSKIIELIYSYLDSTSVIKTNVFLPTSDKDSTIRTDILITKEVAGHQLRIVIKLFPYNNNIDAIDIETFNNELKEIKATKGVIITRGDFKFSATETAEKYLIDLCTIEDAKNRDWNDEVKIPVVINILSPDFRVDLRFTATSTMGSVFRLSLDCLVSHDDLKTTQMIKDLMRDEWAKLKLNDRNIDSGVMDVSDRKWKIRDNLSKKWVDLDKLSLHYRIEKEKYFGYLVLEQYITFTNLTTDLITSEGILEFPRLFNPNQSDIWKKIDENSKLLTENIEPLNVFYTELVNFDKIGIEENSVRVKKLN